MALRFRHPWRLMVIEVGNGSLLVTQRFRRWLSLATLLGSISLSAVPAHAQSTDWTDGTGSWFVGSNWSNGVPSTTANQITVTNGGTAQINGGSANGGVFSTLTITNAGSIVDVQAGGSLFTGTINVNSGGTLLLSGSTAVFTANGINLTNGINLAGGTLRSTVTGSISTNILIGPTGTSTIAAAAGQTLTLSVPIFALNNSNQHLVFGSAVDTGTVVVASSNFGIGNRQATIDVAGGTLRAGNGSLGLITFFTPTIVHAGATLDFNDQALSLLGNLLGDGRVLIGTNATSSLGIVKGTFSGQISGAGQLAVIGFSASDTLTLSGPSDYTGGTLISSGKLQLAGAGTLGNIANSITISENTTIPNLAGYGIASILDLGGSTQVQNGGVTLEAGTIQNGTLSSSGALDVRSGTVSAALTGSGALTKSTAGTVTLSGVNTYTGGTSINAGTLEASHATAGTIDALGTNNITMSGGALRSTVSGTVANNLAFATGATGTITAATGQSVTLTGGVSFGSGSVARFGSSSDTGTILFQPSSAAISLSAAMEVNGGTLRALSPLLGFVTGAIASTSVSAGATLDFNDQLPFPGAGVTSLSGAGSVLTGTNAATNLRIGQGNFSGVIDGAGSVTVSVGESLNGILILTGANTYAGGTSIEPGKTLQLGNGGTSGSIQGGVVNGGKLTFNRSNTYVFDGVISGAGALQQIGNGNLVLTGTNTYSGSTTVNAGTLSVDGSIASSSLTTVNAGGTLGGNGIVGNTTINGGTLAPGNSIGTLTVQGSLVFTAASSYMVEVSPANTDRVNVTGTATLGGATVNASFAAGTYVAKQYTIVNAAGGVSGIFGAQVNTNLPSGFHSSLSYDANDAYLNLALNFVPPPSSGLSGNQQNVANAIVGFFNSNGSIPIVFGGLTPAGLTQAAGETATGSQQTTFDAMTRFLGLLLDPFIDGRGDAPAPAASATPYAEEGHGANAYASSGRKRTSAEREAHAALYNKAPPRNPVFDPRWSVWAAGFGGSQTTDGNVALGSNNTTSRIFGMAAGADYIFSPRTIAGFALAGGGTNFSVVNGGTGRSDLFQAGAFIKHKVGAAYISGALAYGWQDITTDRTVTIAGVDRLRAQFNANAFSGRVEGGYRFVTPWIGGVGITPYAAAQFTTFELPAYAEQVLSGANTFALAYGSKSVTATRSELGVRSDKSFAMPNAILTLRGRFAWAHDFNIDRNIAATFQTLPGASFVVNGAAPAHDAALTTASAEMRWLNGFSLAATFEGEFSDVTRSYAGKGVARYAW